MPTFDEELLKAARLLVNRPAGLRGRLPSARVRRSISTTYYALFHFMLDEVGRRVVGTGNGLRARRQLLARTISHTGMRTAFEKVKGAQVDRSVADFVRSTPALGPVVAPRFIRDMARTFIDAHAKRQDADYNLSETLSEADARLLQLRTRRVIRSWRAATSASDRDAKHVLCLLVLMKGQLRADR